MKFNLLNNVSKNYTEIFKKVSPIILEECQVLEMRLGSNFISHMLSPDFLLLRALLYSCFC